MTEINDAKRDTLGFLCASLHTGASLVIWPSLLEAAEQSDKNLICFPGGRLHAANSFEVQRNAIFDLANHKILDGLITWSSSLGGVLGINEIQRFHQRYHPMPMVSLAQFMEGMPTVSVDSYLGMRALLSHLIEVHGYRKIAFIRGPEEHYYAQERYRAYLDSLQFCNIPLCPELVTNPLPWEAGAEAINSLLDQRQLTPGKDFAAVVAASDLMAIWAMKALQARGYNVPLDVAVTGFNNSIEERLATPPLTTVDLPFDEQGVKAMEVLIQRLDRQAVPALITLPSKLVVRQSCGCPSNAISLASLEPMPTGPQDEAAFREECTQAMQTAANLNTTKAKPWMETIFDGFLEELLTQSGNGFRKLNEILPLAMQTNDDLLHWQNSISVLRKGFIQYFGPEKREKIETLISKVRVLVDEVSQRTHSYIKWQQDRNAEKLREINRLLLTSFDLEQLSDVLAERLPGLGIPSAYLVIYDHPMDGEVPEQARLVLAFNAQKRFPLDASGLIFDTTQIVPNFYLPANRRYSLVVEPLYFQDKSLGYIVFEIGPYDGNVYELLRNTLSSALQGAMLFREIQQARLAAEKADRIKTRLLANVSHEMRTPLNIIIGYSQDAVQQPDKYGIHLPQSLLNDLNQIQGSAEHQLRVINDLLDLSRAEIDELDLTLELIDPYTLLKDAFHNFADQASEQGLTWDLTLPERLPLIRADGVRLKQIILNLLSNARKFTQTGTIQLGAEVSPPQIHFWVSDTGLGIDTRQQERIFEPFVQIEDNRRIAGGIGLGLSITRHLVALHGGTMRLDSEVNKGSTFHIYLPLPVLNEQTLPEKESLPQVVWLISSTQKPPLEIAEISRKQNLEICPLRQDEDFEKILSTTQPAVIAWDISEAGYEDWQFVRRLRNYPVFSAAPFILYGMENENKIGLTGFITKSATNGNLIDTILTLNPAQDKGPILIVDDDPVIRETHKKTVEQGLPGYPILTAQDGEHALSLMQNQPPVLVLLDLMMPGLSGADVLDRMRSDTELRGVPVIILSNKMLRLEDVRRIEHHTRVTLQTKGIWSEAETITVLNRVLFGTDQLPPHTSALVKQGLAFLHQNYTRPISRWQIAEAVGVSEDYFSRVFNRELGLSPWDYLNRYRVQQACLLLQYSEHNIGTIALQVGFKDQAYFSRVFHKIIGKSPQAFRESLL